MHRGRRRRTLALLAHVIAGTVATAIPGALPGAAAAQGIAASQRGAVSQSVAFTEVSVAYGRPVARGRVLFADSGLVKFGQVWHPGADSATRITFSHDVLLEGRPVPAGSYTLWLIPRANAPWTLIVSKAAHVFHAPYPGAERDLLRLEIPTETASHMETFAIYFPVVLRDEAMVRLHWGTVALPVRLKAPYRPPS